MVLGHRSRISRVRSLIIRCIILSIPHIMLFFLLTFVSLNSYTHCSLFSQSNIYSKIYWRSFHFSESVCWSQLTCSLQIFPMSRGTFGHFQTPPVLMVKLLLENVCHTITIPNILLKSVLSSTTVWPGLHHSFILSTQNNKYKDHLKCIQTNINKNLRISFCFVNPYLKSAAWWRTVPL